MPPMPPSNFDKKDPSSTPPEPSAAPTPEPLSEDFDIIWNVMANRQNPQPQILPPEDTSHDDTGLAALGSTMGTDRIDRFGGAGSVPTPVVKTVITNDVDDAYWGPDEKGRFGKIVPKIERMIDEMFDDSGAEKVSDKEGVQVRQADVDAEFNKAKTAHDTTGEHAPSSLDSKERTTLSASDAAGMIHGILGSKQNPQVVDASHGEQSERVVPSSPNIAGIPASVKAGIDTRRILGAKSLDGVTRKMNDRIERENNSFSKKILRASVAVKGAFGGAFSRLLDASEKAKEKIVEKYKKYNAEQVSIEREAHTDIPEGVVFEVDSSHPMLTDVHLHDEHPDGTDIPTMTHEGVVPPAVIHGERVEEKKNSNEQAAVEPSSHEQLGNKVEIDHEDWFLAEPKTEPQEVSPDEALVAAQEGIAKREGTLETISSPDEKAKKQIKDLEDLLTKMKSKEIFRIAEMADLLRQLRITEGRLFQARMSTDDDSKVHGGLSDEEQARLKLALDGLEQSFDEDDETPDSFGTKVRTKYNSLIKSVRIRVEKLTTRKDSKQGDMNQTFGSEVGIKNDTEIKPERFPMQEEVESRALDAWLRIKKATKPMVDFYNKHPTAVKLALSGVLIGGSIVMPAGSAALIGGKYIVRGLGAISAGQGAERVLRARIGKMKVSHNEKSVERAKFLEKHEGYIKYGAMVASFMLGTAADVYFHGLSAIGIDSQDVASHGVSSTAGVSPSVSGAVDHAAGAPTAGGVDATVPVAPEVPVASPTAETIVRHANTLGTTLFHEVTVKAGDTLSHIILSDVLSDIIPPEELAKLSPLGKQNFIANFVSQLTPDQIREIGIKSGDLKSIQIGEHINVKRIVELAQGMSATVNTAGKPSKLSLIARALGLN